MEKKINSKNNLAKPKPKPKPTKSMAGMSGSGKSKGKSTSRASTTAREARDVATAVGNVGRLLTTKYAGSSARGGRTGEVKRAVKDLQRQVREIKPAATSGKKGTRAGLSAAAESTRYYQDKPVVSKGGKYKRLPKYRGKGGAPARGLDRGVTRAEGRAMAAALDKYGKIKNMERKDVRSAIAKAGVNRSKKK